MAATASRLALSLSDTQDAFVFDAHRYALFLGGIGAGKSHAGAVKALVQEIPRPNLGLVIAPTYPMLRDATWRTAQEVWAPVIRDVNRGEMRMALHSGAEVLFRSADDPQHLRGPNASWAWIDEAAQCHPDTWPITIGRLRQHGKAGRCWGTTTPKGMNWVYDVFVVNATPETALFRAATWANPFLDAAFIDSMQQQYDVEFARQELDAEFVADTAASLFEWAWLDAASRRDAPRVAGMPVQAGLDVAGPGEDETVLTVMQAGSILHQAGYPQADPRGEVVAALRPYAGDLELLNVDSAGLGWGMYQHLKDHFGDRVRPINVGEAPTNKARTDQVKFANLKAELYWNARDWFSNGMVDGLSRTALGQLASVRYAHDHAGRVAIEKKADAVKRGVKSPDWAESTILALWKDRRTMQRASWGASKPLARHGRR